MDDKNPLRKKEGAKRGLKREGRGPNLRKGDVS